MQSQKHNLVEQAVFKTKPFREKNASTRFMLHFRLYQERDLTVRTPAGLRDGFGICAIGS